MVIQRYDADNGIHALTIEQKQGTERFFIWIDENGKFKAGFSGNGQEEFNYGIVDMARKFTELAGPKS
jgi:hypothetical protein